MAVGVSELPPFFRSFLSDIRVEVLAWCGVVVAN